MFLFNPTVNNLNSSYQELVHFTSVQQLFHSVDNFFETIIFTNRKSVEVKN